VKKLLVVLLLAALVAGGLWLWRQHRGFESPTTAYRRTIYAAQLGDEERFLEGFTEESATLMRAYLALARVASTVEDTPYRQLVLAEPIGQVVEGRTARVVVQRHKRTFEVPMRLEDGHWKIDALALDETLRKHRR